MVAVFLYRRSGMMFLFTDTGGVMAVMWQGFVALGERQRWDPGFGGFWSDFYLGGLLQ